MIKKLSKLFRNPDFRLVFWFVVLAFICLGIYNAAGLLTTSWGQALPFANQHW